MDYLKMLKGEQLVSITENFDYLTATQEFVGLKLFPMFKTENMKLAIAQLTENGKVPVMALVHAFDTEARIGDRPDYEEIKFELLLVKEKLNQGEALKKKIQDLGMSTEERAIMQSIFNDINNLISRVLTRFEVACDEVLCTGMLRVSENNVSKAIDFGVPTANYLSYSAWSTTSHDIIGDLVSAQKTAKNKIRKAIMNATTFGYLLNNTGLQTIASSYTPKEYVTEDWVKNYVKRLLNIDITVFDNKYKTSAQDTTEYKFIPDDYIAFIATDGEVGKCFCTTTPIEDYGVSSMSNSFVSVAQWKTVDPAGIWTKAEAVALPCPQDARVLFPCKITNPS